MFSYYRCVYYSISMQNTCTHTVQLQHTLTLCAAWTLKKKKQVFMNLLKTANQSKPNSAVKEAIQTRNLGSH